jgi:HNH endonuclease
LRKVDRSQRSCSYPECTGEMKSYRDLCPGHYRQRFKGEELRPLRAYSQVRSVDDLRRICTDVGECWRLRNNDTYGRLQVDGKSWIAHRLAFHIATGEDITGSPIHHKCANTWCVNPSHLQRASNAENSLEMLARKDYEARIAALEARVLELENRLEGLG